MKAPKRTKTPTSFTLPPGVMEMLENLRVQRAYENRSVLVAELIRAEFDRRGLVLPDDAVSSAPAQDPVAARAGEILDTGRQSARRSR